VSDHLEREVVHHHLDWVWTWRGLQAAHMCLACAPGMAYLMVTTWLESWPKLLCLPIVLSALAVVAVLQYRQDARWLGRKLANLGIPHHLSHRLPAEQPPFPVPRQALQCRR
jgi:hypothetical protein